MKKFFTLVFFSILNFNFAAADDDAEIFLINENGTKISSDTCNANKGNYPCYDFPQNSVQNIFIKIDATQQWNTGKEIEIFSYFFRNFFDFSDNSGNKIFWSTDGNEKNLLICRKMKMKIFQFQLKNLKKMKI